MNEITRKYLAASEYELKGDDSDRPGHVIAKFTEFGTVDLMGDVVEHSALAEHDGKPLIMVWGHDWNKQIGLGTIHVKKDYALWEGDLWLDTFDGSEAYKKMRHAGALQEFSWGFRVLEAEPLDEDDADDPWYWGPIRITKTAPIEVSPVLKGANPSTALIQLNQYQAGERKIAKSFFGHEEAEEDDLLGFELVLDPTTPCCDADDCDCETEEVTSGGSEDDADDPTLEAQKRFVDEGRAARVAAQGFLNRAKALVALRAEEGRRPSEAAIAEIVAFRDALAMVTDLVDSLAQPVVDPAEEDRLRHLALAKHRARRLV